MSTPSDSEHTDETANPAGPIPGAIAEGDPAPSTAEGESAPSAGEEVSEQVEKEVSTFIGMDDEAVAVEGDGSATSSSTSSDAAPGTTAPALEQSEIAEPPPSRGRRLLSLPFRGALGALALIDMPFSFLGPTVKTLIGMVAIGTTLMACGVWSYGPRMAAALPAAAPPAQENLELPIPHKKAKAKAEGGGEEGEKKAEGKAEKKEEKGEKKSEKPEKSEKKAEKPEKKAEKPEKKAEPKKEEKKAEEKPEKKAEGKSEKAKKPEKPEKKSEAKPEKKESKPEKKSEGKSEGKSEKKPEKKGHGE